MAVTQLRKSQAQESARIDALCNALEQGLDLKHAAQLAGIGKRTAQRWRTSDEPEHEILRNRIETSISTFVQGNLAALTASRASNPKSAEFLLTHHPETRNDWGDRIETATDTAAAVLAMLTSRVPLPPPASALLPAATVTVDARTPDQTGAEGDVLEAGTGDVLRGDVVLGGESGEQQ